MIMKATPRATLSEIFSPRNAAARTNVRPKLSLSTGATRSPARRARKTAEIEQIGDAAKRGDSQSE